MKKSVLLILTILVCSFVYAGDAEESLWSAAKSGDLAAIKKLVAAGVDVNAKTKYDATALAYACDKGHVDIVRYLLEQGAEVNTTDNFYNFTPLGWAGFNEHVKIIGLLLDNGATGADQILAMGVRNGNEAMVAAAIKGSDLSAEAVAQALTVAEDLEDGEEIVALLKSVEIEVPEREEIVVETSVLETYTGKFQNDTIGMGLDVRLEDG